MPASKSVGALDKQISMRMPSALYDAIARLAAAEQRPVTNYIVKALTDHVAGIKKRTKGGK